MNQLSRRELFRFVTQPIRRVGASEKRAHALAALTRVDAPPSQQCARCYAPFDAAVDETFCPTCRANDAKNRELIRALTKDS